MARIKPKDKLPQLGSWDDVDLALCEIAEHERAIAAAQHRMQQIIDDAKLAAKDESDPHTDAIDALSRQVREFAESNRYSIEKKTKPLMFGNVGWRKSTKMVIPRDPGKVADIIRLLRALDWHDCVKVEAPTINKEALRSHPVEDVVKVGISVEITDEFWLETKKEPIPADKADLSGGVA